MFNWLGRKKGKTRERLENKVNDDKIQPIPKKTKDVEFLLKEHLQDSEDLAIQYSHNGRIALFYLSGMVNSPNFNSNVVNPLNQINEHSVSVDEVYKKIAVPDKVITNDFKKILFKIIVGHVYLHVDGEKEGILINISQEKERAFGSSENETIVYGPQIAFTESLASNTALIRQYLATPMLAIDGAKIGKVSQTKLNIIYIKGIANEQNVKTIKQRINEVEFDGLIDTSQLAQLISDNTWSIFPQYRLTERPEYLGNSLIEGKIAVMMEGSPFAFVAPTTLMNYFQSTEDHTTLWTMGSFSRVLRILAMLLSIFFTATYVAALTFHYEIIPPSLLIPLGESRTKVPFPPLLEALFLEFTIELLREAGARLPTKVGQTMGIVGGIVIGQAAVQAGFTSNILIIIVALSALASFTAPSYQIGATIRILRFPVIVLAGFFGALGIVYGATVIVIHLIKLTSLGNPYLEPYYPFRVQDMKDSILRLPYSFLNKRPIYTRAEDKGRYEKGRTRKNKDIDE